MKNGQFYDFWPFLGRFCIFDPFFSFFWGFSNIFWTLGIMGVPTGQFTILHFFHFLIFLAVFGFLPRFWDFGSSGDLGTFWEC